MKNNNDEPEDLMTDGGEGPVGHSSYIIPTEKKTQLAGMFQSWYLDYASYVILERAIPHIEDGLKPVQRRILHSMKELDDGRFNKVANIVGNTMQYHPHGDASIGDALVQLGQKDILIETQGNWGNILTGDPAAAPRYIEARLSEFALETVFNPKITNWTMSYDGRKPEPVTLPIKFPLLLAQGVEGIAVGLSCRILPHNFNEILDAAISYLHGEPFTLYPDFPTGGYVDISRYNDGERGGAIKVRAKIEKRDSRTLVISDLPYGRTTGKLIESILKAQEKGKIKIKKVDDNTSDTAKIVVQLIPGTSSDKAIDALYAFSDCEVSISPNCCVIRDERPEFLTVSEVLRHNVDGTVNLLKRELSIQRNELLDALHFATLAQIFIEERIYKDKEFEESATTEVAVAHVAKRLEEFKDRIIREVTNDDILKLLDIEFKRIIKYNNDKANERIAQLRERIKEIEFNLEHIIDYTIKWYSGLKEKYGANYPRRTVLRNFDTIEATSVAEANEKLYINRDEGFIGTALKKDEYVCNCSDIDDIIIFYKDGRYKVVKVGEKLYVGKNILYINVFKRNDTRTIYNLLYQNGKGGITYMKRFAVTGITRDKEYDMTQGTPGTKIWWFSANPNGEAEVLRITLKPKFRLKTLQFDEDLANLAIKGRASMGNIVTKNEIHRVALKERGASTLGGREVWFDPDVLRLNYDGRGTLLGEFNGTDQVLVITKDGQFYTTSFDAGNHYQDNILRIEKFIPDKVWTAILYDADQKFPYIKRFTFEPSAKPQSFIGTNTKSEIIELSDYRAPLVTLTYGGADSFRQPSEVNAVDYIGVKSFKARGKRLTTFTVSSYEITENPNIPEESAVDSETDNNIREVLIEGNPKSYTDIVDELTGQQRMFVDDDTEEETN